MIPYAKDYNYRMVYEGILLYRVNELDSNNFENEKNNALKVEKRRNFRQNHIHLKLEGGTPL
jgi:ribosomal protein S4E